MNTPNCPPGHNKMYLEIPSVDGERLVVSHEAVVLPGTNSEGCFWEGSVDLVHGEKTVICLTFDEAVKVRDALIAFIRDHQPAADTPQRQ